MARITIPSEAALWPTRDLSAYLGPATCVSFLRSGDRILAIPSAAGGRFMSHESQVTNCRDSTRHCVPSRFRANSFKTKERRTRYSTLIEGVPQHLFAPKQVSHHAKSFPL